MPLRTDLIFEWIEIIAGESCVLFLGAGLRTHLAITRLCQCNDVRLDWVMANNQRL